MLLVPLTVRQIHSMQNMQAHMPEMKAIQRSTRATGSSMNEELMKFYKENQINPAASCLPMLAQIPVFFALYFVLKASRRTSTAHGDLLARLASSRTITADTKRWSRYVLSSSTSRASSPRRYFMSTTMKTSQRAHADGAAARRSSSFVLHFPTGLMLYWVTTNLWTAGRGLSPGS